MYLLPSIGNRVSDISHRLLQKTRRFLKSKRARYRLASILTAVLLLVILSNGRTSAQRLVTPVVSSVRTFYSIAHNRTTKETFAFIPGLARNKYPYVDLEKLSFISFFDLPVTADGEINRSSRGYASFISNEAAELFDRARYQETKIFLTISAVSENTIAGILENSEAQARLAEQAGEEINTFNLDGITVDFEFPGGGGKVYQERFTKFIGFLTEKIHGYKSGAQVAVAIPSKFINNNDSLYDPGTLSGNSDKIFLIASDFIVPEAKNGAPFNPVYGYNGDEYWKNISNLIGNLHSMIPVDKLSLERAWYGNGYAYPLYIPQSKAFSESTGGPSQIQLDETAIENLAAGVPYKGRAAARKNIPLIAKALSDEGILDSNVLAYALATVEHETDETFEPIGEIQGAMSARRLGYEGGANYFGRGFIQITHLRNYRQIGERIGIGDSLVKNPELASDPVIAAKVLAAFFKDNNVANLASQGYFVAARRPINPDYNGYSIASLAMKYGVF